MSMSEFIYIHELDEACAMTPVVHETLASIVDPRRQLLQTVGGGSCDMPGVRASA